MCVCVCVVGRVAFYLYIMPMFIDLSYKDGQRGWHGFTDIITDRPFVEQLLTYGNSVMALFFIMILSDFLMGGTV